jgi:hypothetical protein
VIELFSSDMAILVISCAGLAATAVSIVRDARAERERQLVIAQGVRRTDNVRQLVTEDVRAEAA